MKSGRGYDQSTYQSFATLSQQHREVLERMNEMLTERATTEERLLGEIAAEKQRTAATQRSSNETVSVMLHRIDGLQGQIDRQRLPVTRAVWMAVASFAVGVGAGVGIS